MTTLSVGSVQRNCKSIVNSYGAKLITVRVVDYRSGGEKGTERTFLS